MPFQLDHVVIAVADLDSAFHDYTALGFTVVRGGEHANGRTHNCLVVFGDGAYLELIAFKMPDPANRWSAVYHGAGEGFLDYALLPRNIVADVAAAQALGLDIVGPTPGGRNRPDGVRLEWQIARSPTPDVPFLCGDVTPRGLRVPEGDVRHHANGVIGIAGLTVAVRDLDAALARNAALHGMAVPSSSAGAVGGAPARHATFGLGDTLVTLASPADAGGSLAAHLARRGDGPFALTFRGKAAEMLDPSLTHGATLAIEAGDPAR